MDRLRSLILPTSWSIVLYTPGLWLERCHGNSCNGFVKGICHDLASRPRPIVRSCPSSSLTEDSTRRDAGKISLWSNATPLRDRHGYYPLAIIRTHKDDREILKKNGERIMKILGRAQQQVINRLRDIEYYTREYYTGTSTIKMH